MSEAKREASALTPLLCCPFCGSNAAIHKEGRGDDSLDDVWVVGCDKCPAEMVGIRVDDESIIFHDELEEIIAAWNRRAT